jgi:cytochrome c oxidase subunit II
MIKFVLFLLAMLAVAAYGLYLLFPAAFKPSGRAGGHKRWAYLFGITLALEALTFVVAPIFHLWLPKGVSTYSGAIDALFYVILAVTGITFIAVSIVFTFVLFKYAADPSRRSIYTHGNHKLEMVWSAVPAILLVVLAVGQIPAWLEVKDMTWLKHQLDGDGKQERFLQIEVAARQWEWRMRYPSSARMAEWSDHKKALADVRSRLAQRPDDVRATNEIHCVKGQKVLIHLKTQDVIHSLYLPQLRLKQDALPGKTIQMWFEAMEANCQFRDGAWQDGLRRDDKKGTWVKDPAYIWEIACAEYCGARHSLMRGKLYVHETQEDFDQWLKSTEDAGRKTMPDGK